MNCASRTAPHQPGGRETWIALLRGVNVGGNNSLPMKGLRELLEGLGHTNVATYIQSGNCVFQSKSASAAKISEGIAAAIKSGFGFKPAVITLSLKELDAALEDNPFPQGSDDLKSVYVFFLSETTARRLGSEGACWGGGGRTPGQTS